MDWLLPHICLAPCTLNHLPPWYTHVGSLALYLCKVIIIIICTTQLPDFNLACNDQAGLTFLTYVLAKGAHGALFTQLSFCSLNILVTCDAWQLCVAIDARYTHCSVVSSFAKGNLHHLSWLKVFSHWYQLGHHVISATRLHYQQKIRTKASKLQNLYAWWILYQTVLHMLASVVVVSLPVLK